jgi:excisionase family DNA binding protein
MEYNKPQEVMPLDELLTVKEVMAALKVSRPTIYAMRERGDLEAVKIGKAVRFRRSDVENLMRGNNKPE